MNDKDLVFLQELNEAELCELVIMPLLAKMGYTDIRYTHGALEKGKDIVFTHREPLVGNRRYSAAVKCKQLSGSVTATHSIHEVYFQINQALREPFIDPFDGLSVHLDGVFVVTPFAISPHCIESLSRQLQDLSNRVNFVDGPKLLGLIRDHYPQLLQSLPDPRRRYLQTICQRFLDNAVIKPYAGEHSPSIMDIYIGGTLADTSPEEAKYISFALPYTSTIGRQMKEVFSEGQHCVVLADVGAGKTTLLQRFALDLAGFENGVISIDATTTPLVIPLAQLPVEDIKDYQSFLQSISDHIEMHDGFENFAIGDNQRFVLLLDGFDELPSNHDMIAQYIQQLHTTFPSGVVLTSRPSRMPLLSKPFRYVRLLPFANNEIFEFMTKWFPENEETRRAMYTRITETPELQAFCRTPLMLTLYAILGQRYSVETLPTRKTDIYDAIVNMLLGDWDSMRNIKNLFDRDMKQYVLERLAYGMHEKNKRYFDLGTLEKIVEDLFSACGLNLSGDLMINEIIYRSSLIRKATGGGYDFVHLSFQEFFVAKYMVRIQDTQVAQKRLTVDWWRNALLFYFGTIRTMDGLFLPSKRYSGEGLRLMTFLLEAVFTSVKTQETVYNILANDVLFSVLSRGDINMCARLGNGIIGALEPKVRSLKFKGNAYNYMRILLALNSQEARQKLFQCHTGDCPPLEQLGIDDLLDLCERLFLYLNTEEARKFFQAVVERLTKQQVGGEQINTELSELYKRESRVRSLLIDMGKRQEAETMTGEWMRRLVKNMTQQTRSVLRGMNFVDLVLELGKLSREELTDEVQDRGIMIIQILAGITQRKRITYMPEISHREKIKAQEIIRDSNKYFLHHPHKTREELTLLNEALSKCVEYMDNYPIISE